MTREEAYNRIDAIIAKHEIDDEYVTVTNEKDYDALRLCRKVIEQKPCEDAISRQAVLISIKNLYPDMPVMDIMGSRRKWLDKYAPYFECENAVERLPSVNPQPKTGHWIDDTRLGYHVSICSNCNWRGHGDTCLIYKPKYCPNCGAKMSEIPTGSESEE